MAFTVYSDKLIALLTPKIFAVTLRIYHSKLKGSSKTSLPIYDVKALHICREVHFLHSILSKKHVTMQSNRKTHFICPVKREIYLLNQ